MNLFSGRIAIPSRLRFSVVGFWVLFIALLCLVFVCVSALFCVFCVFWFGLLFFCFAHEAWNALWTMYRSAIALFCDPSTLTVMHGN